MKRMWAVVAVIILFSLWMLQALGQKVMRTQGTQSSRDDREDQIKRRLQLREEMHKRMRDKILHGIGPNDDLFKDMEQMMNESMADSFAGMDMLAGDSGSSIDMNWTETKTGRTLTLSPKDPSQKIDLDVNSTTITIKSQAQNKTENGVSESRFQSSLPVPQDCDGSKVKMSNKDGKIVMEFPFRVAVPTASPKKKENSRMPLPPAGNEIEI